jgi:hypothetical protein
LVDTSAKDRHVLASARAAKCHAIVTRNIRHFGHRDLAAAGLAALHPDLFLARAMSWQMYVDTLEAMAATRSRQPNTPAALHAAIGTAHPLLFNAMRGVYPGVEAAPNPHRPPAQTARGTPSPWD